MLHKTFQSLFTQFGHLKTPKRQYRTFKCDVSEIHTATPCIQFFAIGDREYKDDLRDETDKSGKNTCFYVYEYIFYYI